MMHEIATFDLSHSEKVYCDHYFDKDCIILEYYKNFVKKQRDFGMSGKA